MRHLFLAVWIVTCTFGCAPARQPVPVGVIPSQQEVPLTDEQFGHEVFSKLSEQYPLDRDDDRINRTRDIVARLTSIQGNDRNVWHTHVFVGDEVQNAAATRGNHIFVWTGMLKNVKNDDELATVLAHEIGHVLANHTQPTPAEEVSVILADVAGQAAKSVVYQQGAHSALASIAGLLIQETVKAVAINPASQEKELEADMIGLFLMADAGYDPRRALDFWKRQESNPAFSAAPAQFLSSHPSSEERIEQIERLLPEALARSRQLSGDSYAVSPPATVAPPPPRRVSSGGREIWVVAEDYAEILVEPNDRSTLLIELPRGSEVTVDTLQGRWLKIHEPVRGYARSHRFSPRR